MCYQGVELLQLLFSVMKLQQYSGVAALPPPLAALRPGGWGREGGGQGRRER